MNSDRRQFLSLLGTAAVAAAFPKPLRALAGNSPSLPNIIFILADDLGYGDLACFGHPHLKTPYLDQLAAEGLKLTQCYSPSPLCSASRAGFLTGRTPYRTGIESWIPEGSNTWLHSKEKTVATLLKEVGYDTFLAGKWHLNGKFNSPDQPQPDDHGFDYWLATQNYAHPTHRNPNNFVRNGEALGVVEGFACQIVIDEAIEWLQNRKSNNPFFQYISTHEPHSEIASPDRFNEMYAQYTKGTPDPLHVTPRGPGEYYANISHLDYQLGRLFRKLDELEIRDDTIVIFTSDNGPVTDQWRYPWEINMYGSTGGLRGRKGDLYEGGIRVPGIIRFPGRISPAAVSPEPVFGCDLLPTLCSLTGIPLPTDRPLDGADFSPLFNRKSITRQQPLYWQFSTARTLEKGENHPFPVQFALRKGNWKLLADKSLKKFELYNLAEDPAEENNRAEQNKILLSSLLEDLRLINQSVSNDPLNPSLLP